MSRIIDLKEGQIIKVQEPTQIFSYDLYSIEEIATGALKLRVDEGNLFDEDNELITFPLDLLRKSQVTIIAENLTEFIENIS